MAEENEGGGGLNLGRKVGPLPMYVWIMGAGAVGLIIFRLIKGGGTQGTTSGNPGQGNQFSSSQSYTNPQTGESTSYTAQGNGYLPGMLTYGASPMPYSGGDIYVNYPASSNTTGSTSAPPPPVNPKDIDDPNAYGRSQIQTIRGLIGKGEYTQDIVNDVQAAYDKEAAHYGQQYADLQHYSYIGPGNVQAIPRHLTAAQQITTGLPSNPKWGQYYPNALVEAYPGLGSGLTAPSGGTQNGS